MSLKAQARKRLLTLLGIALFVVLLFSGWLIRHAIKDRHRFAFYREEAMAMAAASTQPLAPATPPAPGALPNSGGDREVVNLLGTYLRRYPNDADAWAAYAHARMNVLLPAEGHGANIRDAVHALENVLRIDPTRVEEWRRLMSINYRYGLMTEANDTADNLLAHAPGDAMAMDIKVSALINLKKFDQAQSAAEARLKVAPHDWFVLWNEVRIMTQQHKQPQEISALIDAAVKGHENEQGSLLLQACAAQLNQQSDKVLSCLRAASTQPSTDINIANPLVSYLDDTGMHAEAIQVLQNTAKQGDPLIQGALVRRLWETDRLQEVADFCAANVAMPLHDSEIEGIYANTLHRLGKNSPAAQARDELASRTGDLLAVAWSAIEKADIAPNRDNALAEGVACEAAADQQPRDAYLIYFQGCSQLILGETDAAIDDWTKASKLDLTWYLPPEQAAQRLLAEGRLDLAAGASIEAQHRAPWAVGPAITQCMVWFATLDSAKPMGTAVDLSNLIDEIQQRVPGEEQTLRMRVALLARTGNTAKAAEVLQGMLDKQPPAAALTLSSLADISRQYKLGLEGECLKVMEQHYGRSPQSVLAEALDSWRRQKDDSGLKMLQAAAQSATGRQAIGYHMAIARYLEVTNDPGATAAWVALGDQYSDELNVQEPALSSPAASRDRAFYDRTIDRVHKLLGDQSIIWKLPRARWLLDAHNAKNIPDAVALIQNVLQHEPDSVEANILLGQAKVENGDVTGAAAQYAIAQRLSPKSTAIAMEMAELLQSRGDFTGAHQQLDMVISEPDAPAPRLARAGALLMAQGDMDGAIGVFEKLSTGPAATVMYRQELAMLYCRTKHFDKAQAVLDGLLKNPDASTIALAATLDMFRQQRQAAEAMLARLKELKWTPGQLERTLGNWRYGVGQFDQALTEFRAAATAAPTDASNWLALMSCQASMGKAADIAATSAQAAQHVPNDAQIAAIQNQAASLAAVGDGPSQRLLLAAFIADPSPTGPAAKTVQAVQAISDPAMVAGDVLEKLQKLSLDLPQFLPAQLTLIEEQLRRGRCADAIQSANRAVQAFPNEPRPAELATLALCNYGQWDQALQMAHTWKSRVITDNTNVDVQIARIQLSLGDAAGAIATLQPYLQSSLPADAKWDLLLIQAQALARQGKTDDAAATLWPVAQTTPAARAPFTAFVVSVLPPPQAEQWLKRMGDLLASQPNTELTQVDLATKWAMLSQRGANPGYAQIAHELIARLEQVPAASAQAYLANGIFQETAGNAAGAQTAYRASIAKGNLAEAKNNLAMILTDHGGDLKEAISLATQCTQSDPNQAAYDDTLAYILGKAKNYDQAIAAMRTAVRLEPDNAKWRVNLAKLLVAAGQIDKARQTIAELDLMTPGARSLSDKYKQDLQTVRKQLTDAPGSASLIP